MKSAISAASGCVSVCSNRPLPQRLRAVATILTALAVLGVICGLVDASVIVSATAAW